MPPFGFRSRNLATGESGRDGSISSILAAPSSTEASRTPCSGFSIRGPTASPYLSLSCRAAAAMSGTTMETWFKPVIMTLPSRPAALCSDDFLLAQLRDRLLIQPQLALEDFIVVLPEYRRCAPHRAGGVGELERDPEHLEGADGGMLDRLDHVARGRMRIVERVGDRIDASAGTAHRLELVEPGIGIVVRKRLVDEAVDHVAVLDAGAVAGEAWVLRPFGMAKHLGDAPELALVADPDGDHRVGGLIGRVGDDAGMAVAEAAGVAARGQVVRGDIDEHRERGLVQRELDLLALAGAMAGIERGEDGVAREHPGADVDDRDAVF